MPVKNPPTGYHSVTPAICVRRAAEAIDFYKRAFGAEPGRIKAIAIMTDSDNTGDAIEAYYGDIAFLTEAQVKALSLVTGSTTAED